jgi:hypothetical protein
VSGNGASPPIIFRKFLRRIHLLPIVLTRSYWQLHIFDAAIHAHGIEHHNHYPVVDKTNCGPVLTCTVSAIGGFTAVAAYLKSLCVSQG